MMPLARQIATRTTTWRIRRAVTSERRQLISTILLPRTTSCVFNRTCCRPGPQFAPQQTTRSSRMIITKQYSGSAQPTMPSKKVLIVLSDAESFPMEKTRGHDAGQTVDQPSGYFLMELVKPLDRLLNAGYEVAFASPEGKEPKPDPNSESLLAFAGNFYEHRRENEVVERMKKENGFSRPRQLSEITDEELESFSGVLLPGGHSPLKDLGDNPALGKTLWHFHERQKPTAAICHGPYAFLSTSTVGDAGFAYKGYKMTSWSDQEEKVMEMGLGGNIPKVESQLREAGAEMIEGIGEKAGSITVDREVVSGGNPLAAAALGDKFLEMLLQQDGTKA